jgi:hypothetical protein
MTRIAPYVIAALALGLSACTNPYDPVQRGLGGAYWERPLERPLGQRRVAGREPPSEQRSAGQPGYLGESLVHLHRHRAPITAIRPTDLLLTDIRDMHNRVMDIQATPHSPPTRALRAMDRQATPDIPPTRAPRPMDRQATRDTLPTPVLRAMDRQATRDTPLTPDPRPMDTRADRHTPVPVMGIP